MLRPRSLVFAGIVALAARSAAAQCHFIWDDSVDLDIPDPSSVSALVLLGDGPHPVLWAGGSASASDPEVGAASYRNGFGWRPVGPNPGFGTTLAVFDDGSGPAIYAGGAL